MIKFTIGGVLTIGILLSAEMSSSRADRQGNKRLGMCGRRWRRDQL
jgi:hypothetical protein